MKQFQLPFAAHTTIAALLALTLSALLGLAHPFWAAMTVWLVAQANRGLLFERAMARLLGTFTGACAAYVIFTSTNGSLVLMLATLSFWVATCSGVASLFRHFLSYGILLVGYTTAILVLLGVTDPALQSDLAASRIACTVIGILCSALVSGLFTANANPGSVRDHQDDIMQQVLHAAAAPAPAADWPLGLLRQIGAIEAESDALAAGSLKGHKQARLGRTLLAALTNFMADISQNDAARPGPEILTAFADAIEGGTGAQEAARLRRLDLPASFRAVLAAYAAVTASEAGDASSHGAYNDQTLPDWQAFHQNATRTGCALTIASAIWLISGWSQGPYMVMTAAIFTTLFSNFPNPQLAVRDTMRGSIAGAGAGLLYSGAVMPHIDGLAMTILAITPLLLLGAWAMSRPGTAKAAIDLNMTFLLTVQPGDAMAQSGWLHALNQSAAILLGVTVATFAFHFLWPRNPARNAQRLKEVIRRDLDVMTTETTAKTALRRRGRIPLSLLRLAAIPDVDQRDVKEGFSMLVRAYAYASSRLSAP